MNMHEKICPDSFIPWRSWDETSRRRNDLIHETVLRFTPRLKSLYISKLWSTLLDALLKSIIIRSVYL